jgi:hypothetical protein
MISTLKIINKLLLLTLVFVLCPLFTSAQTSLSLSVSPTLFEMTANPGQEWESVVRVINSNSFDITVYSDVVNFAPQGEGGQGKFLPVLPGETEGQTLAEWLSFGKEAVLIPAEQTLEIPFAIDVPVEAPPGGHFAALLIGTKPPKDKSGQSKLETSQIVTSLVFLRVTGDVIEEGAIRSFRSTSFITESPEMGFELRFENKGNVHILPQGEIKIFNMWGQERGIIPINRQSLFGNVLPEQIRKYSYSWTGEWSFSDMGRYKAVTTLAYGVDARQFVSSETFFWVLPWKIASVVLLVIISFIYTVTWAIKLYIRKVFAMAGVLNSESDSNGISNRPVNRKMSIAAPIEEGMLDLRNRFMTSVTWQQKISSTFDFVILYRQFFLVAFLVIIFLLASVWYIRSASVEDRGYEITIDAEGTDVKISSEEIEYEKLRKEQQNRVLQQSTKDFPVIRLVNQSGVNGLAAEMRLHLEESGYIVRGLSSDYGSTERNTVIVYHSDFAEQALELSGEITGALLSAYADALEEEPLTIFVGQDYKSEVQ